MSAPAAPPPPLRPRSRRRPGAGAALGAATAALALALAGCGSSGGSGNEADPATVVPAAAPLYLGADVRPQGNEKAGAAAVGRSLSGQADPYTRLLLALQTPGSPTLDFGRDVAPWLGPHAGIFLSSLSGVGKLLPVIEQALLGSSGAAAAYPFGTHGAQGAIVMDTSDASKASSFLNSQASHAGAHAATYRGEPYQVTATGIAFAMVDHLAVIGSEGGVHEVIDTSISGGALKSSQDYSKLLSSAPAGALAHLYTNPTQQDAGAKLAAGPLLALTGSRPANISLVPSTSSLAVYVDATSSASTGTPGGLLSSAVEGGAAFDELPGDSWLAVGLDHVGTTLSDATATVSGLLATVSSLTGSAGAANASPLSLGGLVEGIISPLAVLGANTQQAKAEFASWMGSAGVFASGSGLLELKAAVVIESKVPTLSREAVGKLAAELRKKGDQIQPASIPGTDAAVGARVKGLPVLLYIANGKGAGGATKFVLGLGEASVTAALSPSSTLASSAARTSGATTLGEGLQPSLLFEVPTLVGLLEGIGLTEDPTLSKLAPTLKAIASVTAGGHSLGSDVERYKLVLALQPAAG